MTLSTFIKRLQKLEKSGLGDHEIRVYERGSVYDWAVTNVYKDMNKLTLEAGEKHIILN